MRAAERVYRLALRTCPERFQDEFGEDSVRDFLCLVEEKRDRIAVAYLCVRASWDLIRTAARERRRAEKRGWSALPQNLRDARRNLLARPGFSLLVIVTLALGIGANSAIFDVVYESILKPLPFTEPDGLVVVAETNLEAETSSGDSVTPANFEDWRSLSTSFEDLAAMVQTSMNLTGDGEPERVVVHRVSSSLFSILGVSPLHGRTFVPEEEEPGGERVVLASHAFWQRRLGGREGALGEDILLDGVPHRIIGVLPAWMRFPSRHTSLFVPLAMDADEKSSRNAHYLEVVGRVRGDVTLAQAAQEMDAIAARLRELHPESNADNGVLVRPLRADLVGEGTTRLVVLFLAVSAVVLIAVVNVANLLLARSTSRQREVAVRAALGASRSRILGQLMTESAVLAFSGAAAGVVLAILARRLLESLTPPHVVLDPSWWRPATFSFALVLAFTVAIGMGLLPALQLSRMGHGPLLGLRASSARSSSRLRGALVAGEVALALLLLLVGGLMVRSFFNLTLVHPGFRAENVVTMRIELSGSRYREHHQKLSFYRDLESHVARLPGVVTSGFVTMLPLTFSGGSISFEIEDRVTNDAVEPIAVFRSVTPGYFRTLGIPVMEGRGFDTRDGSEAPKVAVVNRALARTFFPGESPLGARLGIWGESTDIIGVVGDVHELSVRDDPRPAIYVASEQRSFGFFDPRDFAIHTRSDPASLVPAIRAEVWSIDADQPIASIRTMDEVVARAVVNDRLQTVLLAAFGLVALLLAALGIYGVLSYAVSQRTGEIGLRMALGARRSDVLRMVAGQGAVLTLVGVGIGLGAATFCSRFLQGMIYRVEPFDIGTIAGAVTLIGLVAMTACALPGLRATRIDPLDALREE